MGDAELYTVGIYLFAKSNVQIFAKIFFAES